MSNPELSSNIHAMLNKLNQHTEEVITNNLPHATATTNAWRDSITQLAQTASAISLLCTQAHSTESSVPGILRSKNATANITSSLNKIQSMTLIFDTQTRQALKTTAIKKLSDCLTDVKALENAPGSSSSSSSSSSVVGSTKFRASPPISPKAQPTLYGSGAGAGNADADAAALSAGASGLRGTNIKPQTKMTFSSLEGSASARLGGITGKCAKCGAARSANDGAFCGSCGANCNIVF